MHPGSTASQGKTSTSQRMRLLVQQRDKLGTLAEARQSQFKLCFHFSSRLNKTNNPATLFLICDGAFLQVPLWFYHGLLRLSPSHPRVPLPPAAKPHPRQMMMNVWMSPSLLRQQAHSDTEYIIHLLPIEGGGTLTYLYKLTLTSGVVKAVVTQGWMTSLPMIEAKWKSVLNISSYFVFLYGFFFFYGGKAK